MMSTMSIQVIQHFPDGDNIAMSYAIPTVIDSVNGEAACTLVAETIHDLVHDLEGLDKHFHIRQ